MRTESVSSTGTWSDFFWYGYPGFMTAHDDYASSTIVSPSWSGDNVYGVSGSSLHLAGNNLANSANGIGSTKYATFTYSASISGTTLTMADANSGMHLGTFVSGTGVTAGTYVVSGSGKTWTLNNSMTVASSTLTFQRPFIGTNLNTAPNYNELQASNLAGNSGKCFKYGYFEARLRVPAVKGYWPTWWLYTSTSNGKLEIDIAEFQTRTQTSVQQSLHVPSFGSQVVRDDSRAVTLSTAGVSGTIADYHTYGLLWTSTQLKFYVDNILTNTMNHTEFTQPMWLIFSNGPGSWDSNDNIPDPGNFGLTMDVDWVKVWQ